MTANDTDLLDRIVDAESRRSFLRKSALVTAATGVTASGTAAAQDNGGNAGDDDDAIVNDQRISVAMFRNDFRGGARFLITSDVVSYTPNIPPDLGGPFTGYNTYVATYLNSSVRINIFVSQEANLGANYDEDQGFFVDDDEQEGDEFNEPALFELANDYSDYGDTDRVVNTFAYPLEQDAQNQVFNQEGFDSEEDVNDFLF